MFLLQAVKKMRARLTRPPQSAAELIATLERLSARACRRARRTCGRRRP